MKQWLTYLFVIFAAAALAQGRKVDTTIFEYEDKGKFPVANSYKLQESPSAIDTLRIVPSMKYSIHSRPAYPRVYLVPIKAAKMEGEPLKKLYSGYATAGMGTYTMPLLDIRYNNLRSKSSSMGIHARHLSSASRLRYRGYAGWSDDVLEGNVKYFLKKHSLNSSLSYLRNGQHYYGYNDTLNPVENNDFLKQVFHRTTLSTVLQSHYSDSNNLNQRIAASFQSLFDRFDVNESRLLFSAELGKEWKKNYFGGIFGVDYLNDKQKFVDTNNSVIAWLTPYVKFIGSRFRARLGGTIALDFSARNRFYIYPDLEVNYNVANIIVPYGGVTGRLQRNSYSSLAFENPFLDPVNAFRLKNTDIPFELYGGLRGSLSRSMAYNLRASYRKMNDQYFFVTDTVEGTPDLYEMLENRFNAVYDSVGNFMFSGELKYSSSEKFNLYVRGEYQAWRMGKQRYPWHRPVMNISSGMRYNLRDKIEVNLDLFYYSSRLAPVRKAVDADGFVELPGYADVNLNTRYHYNRKLSFFLSFHNLAGARYERWYYYPSQRLQVMGGLSLSF